MTGTLAMVVDQRGATLELGTHGTLAMIDADGRRERVGLRALGSVVLHGEVTLGTGVLRALCAHGVALTVLPLRGGRAAAVFSQQAARHAGTRHRQHLAYADSQVRLALARKVVRHKLASAAGRCPDGAQAFLPALAALERAASLPALMGVEGAAAALHFDGLRATYASQGPFGFEGRTRRPPKDAPNALMSLSYRLAQDQAVQLALRHGLDAQLGFLHEIHRDRPSFALDLLEPARAVLDAWVHELLNVRQVLQPSHFAPQPDGGVQLVRQGRAIFYPLWFSEGHARAMPPIRSLLGSLLRAIRATPCAGLVGAPGEQGHDDEPL